MPGTRDTCDLLAPFLTRIPALTAPSPPQLLASSRGQASLIPTPPFSQYCLASSVSPATPHPRPRTNAFNTGQGIEHERGLRAQRWPGRDPLKVLI